MSEIDDVTLVRQCTQGNPNIFGAIVDRYQAPIFNVALRMVSDFDDANDITQAVFIKAFENLTSFNPKYKFFSWIYRIAVNESINFLNKKKPVLEIPPNTRANAKSPQEQLEQQELSNRIHEALMGLPIEQRAIIILKHLEGFSYAEIGYILEIPEKTVKSRLFSSRQQLRSLLLKQGILSDDR